MSLKKSLRVAFLVFALCSLSIAAGGQTGDAPESLLDAGQYSPDIATFMQIGANISSGCTWDGETVFFTSRASGAGQVYRLTETGWPYQLTTFEDGVDFFTLSWGGDKGIVGASVGGSEQSQLFLVDTETGRSHQLTKGDIRYGGVVWAIDDRSILYSSNEENLRDFNIFQMDLLTGESHKVFGNAEELNGSKWIADMSQDGTKLIVMRYNSNVDQELFLVDIATGEYEPLTQDETDVIYDYPILMPDNKTVWLLCNANEEGSTRLAKMVVGSPDIEFVEDGWVDPQWEIEGFGMSRDFKYMYVTVNEDGYMRLKLREFESKRELPSPPLDGQVGGASFDKNGACVFSFNGPTRAPDVWRWNPATEELTQLTFSKYAGIDREVFSEPELVRFKSFDGLEIPAFLYLPPDYKKGEAIPFVINAHGGPESQFTPVFIRNIQYLILNGYGVLAVNPRGSSGYGREYLNLDNYKLRKNSLKDYKAAADWLVAEGYTAPGMMGIRGGSYGGYVVLGMITEYPDLFSAAIDIVGIANFKTFLENTRSYRRHLREAEYGPLSDPDFLDSISPIHKANLIKTPLLVIHGVNDPRVPIGEARQIIQAVQDNQGIVDSLIFHDEGHGSGKTANVILEYRTHISFLDTHLKSLEVPKTEE